MIISKSNFILHNIGISEETIDFFKDFIVYIQTDNLQIPYYKFFSNNNRQILFSCNDLALQLNDADAIYYNSTYYSKTVIFDNPVEMLAYYELYKIQNINYCCFYNVINTKSMKRIIKLFKKSKIELCINDNNIYKQLYTIKFILIQTNKTFELKFSNKNVYVKFNNKEFKFLYNNSISKNRIDDIFKTRSLIKILKPIKYNSFKELLNNE